MTNVHGKERGPPSSPSGGRHILLITYEFNYSPFSGNGILAQSLVKSLCAINDEDGRPSVHLTVWCCRPHEDHETSPTPISLATSKNDPEPQNVTVFTSNLSQQAGWKRVDVHSGWKEFEFCSLSPSGQQELLRRLDGSPSVESFQSVCVVDWTGAHAYRSLVKQVKARDPSSTKSSLPPVVYLNFRVYSSGLQTAGDVPSLTTSNLQEWYDQMELAALQNASITLALSDHDRQTLHELWCKQKVEDVRDSRRQSPKSWKEVHVLPPPLRGDIQALALQRKEHEGEGQSHEKFLSRHLPSAVKSKLDEYDKALSENNDRHHRCLITCVVRMSPEKDTLRFAHFCETFRDIIREKGYIVVLAGAASDDKYARRVKDDLQRVFANPADSDGRNNDSDCLVIIESFISPMALAAIFSRSILNFHPCAYEAYGMTIIEAAAFGVPSILACGSQVGASSTLMRDTGETRDERNNETELGCTCIQVPMDQPVHVADGFALPELSNEAKNQIYPYLTDHTQLLSIGNRARERALAWDEATYGRELYHHITSVSKSVETKRRHAHDLGTSLGFATLPN